MGKVATGICIGLTVLFGLWLVGGVFHLFGSILGLFAGLVGLIFKLLFSKAFWFFAIVGGIVYWVTSCKQESSPSPLAHDHDHKVADLEKRLDRLNRMI